MEDFELFDEARTELLEEGLLAFLDVRKNIPTCIRLNPDTFYIEWCQEDRSTKRFYMSYYLFHNRLDIGVGNLGIGLEINSVAPNQFLPAKQEFFFSSEQKRRKLEVFLEHSREMIRQMTYTNDLLNMYQHREFNTLLPDPDAEEVDKRDVKKYFKNVGLTVPKGYLPDKRQTYKFEDWKKLYADKLAEESSASLKDVFDKFSTCVGQNEERLMTPENLADFLKRHQQESKHRADEELSGIMRRHMEKVDLLNNLILNDFPGKPRLACQREYHW